MFKSCFNKCMKLIGITLIIFFFLLYFMIFYSYIYDLCQIYYIRYERSLPVGIAMMAIGYYLGFNILYNYIMGIFVHPGKNNNIRRASYKLNGQDDSDEDDDEGQQNNFRNQRNSLARVCRKCNDYKPLRAHHCSICNECVYKMDHHCPWLDNCVGFENHRYFLLFILYLLISMIYIAILFIYIDMYPLEFKEAKQHHTKLYPATKMLAYILSFVLLAFNAWNWYLAIIGYTAIEFWGQRQDGKDSNDFSFAQPTARDNLFVIFGTRSYFSLMLPSYRQLPHDGTKWEISKTKYSTKSDSRSDLEGQTSYRRSTIQSEEYEEEEEQKFNSFGNNQQRNKEYENDIEGGL